MRGGSLKRFTPTAEQSGEGLSRFTPTQSGGGLSRFKPDQSGGNFFTGLGQTLKRGAQGVSQGVKRTAEGVLQRTIDREAKRVVKDATKKIIGD